MRFQKERDKKALKEARRKLPFFPDKRETALPTDNSEKQSEWGVKATIFRRREWLSMDLRVWGGFIIQTAANFNKLPAIRRLNFEISSLREKKKKIEEKVVDKKLKSWSWSQQKSSLLSWISNSQRISKAITGRYLQNTKYFKRSSKHEWFEMSLVVAFSPFSSFSGRYTLPPVTPDASAQVCDNRLWRGPADDDVGDMTGVTSASRRRLPRKVSDLQKAGQGETLGQPFIRKWCASWWWAPSPHLFFIFGNRQRPAFSIRRVRRWSCELMWNEQSERDQRRWYSSTAFFSLWMSDW